MNIVELLPDDLIDDDCFYLDEYAQPVIIDAFKDAYHKYQRDIGYQVWRIESEN